VIVALFGPTASGKSMVAGALLDLLDGEVVSADSAALYADLPIITAAPEYPARLVGVVPLEDEVSAAGYQRLAHDAIDEILAAGRTPIVVGGTGLYFRAALGTISFPPPPAPGARERWTAVYEELGPDEVHALLAQRDPDAAARIHPNDRRRVVRALELAEAGSSLAGDELWAGELRHPTLVCSLVLDQERLENRIRARAKRMLAEGARDEAAAAWARPLSPTARKVLGLEEFATLPLDEAVERVTLATTRLARYQRKWLRRMRGVVTLDANRPPEEIAADIVALGRTGQHLSRHD
jgi:tRNA dimethylallyltransferase